jgi:transposase-like protein
VGLEPTAAAQRPTTQATLPSADHAVEIARLQRENERLRMERDILKKSIAIFVGASSLGRTAIGRDRYYGANDPRGGTGLALGY